MPRFSKVKNMPDDPIRPLDYEVPSPPKPTPGATIIRTIVLIFSLAAIAFGALMVIGSQQYFYYGAPADRVDLRYRFLLCGCVLILIGIWQAYGVFHRVRRKGPVR